MLRHTNKLLISYIKPHREISKDTIFRWIKSVMKASDINTDEFSSHSCRSAASSKARVVVIPLSKILANAGWANERAKLTTYSKEKNTIFFSWWRWKLWGAFFKMFWKWKLHHNWKISCKQLGKMKEYFTSNKLYPKLWKWSCININNGRRNPK